MRTRCLAAVLVACSVLVGPSLAAQSVPTLHELQLAPIPQQDMTPAQIRQAIDKVKKGRTLLIVPAVGLDDPQDNTTLALEDKSPFPLSVFVAGPTTFRVDLQPEETPVFSIEPGEYEIVVQVTGKDLPPFYGRQTVEAKKRFRHQFVIPIA